MQGPPRISQADRDAMAEWGIGEAQLHREPEEVSLWPETVQPFRLFTALLTQWRMGPAGPIGLDYGALPVAARMLRLSGRRLREAFAGLRTMESEALAVFAERSARAR